jgi:hypothetical protein
MMYEACLCLVDGDRPNHDVRANICCFGYERRLISTCNEEWFTHSPYFLPMCMAVHSLRSTTVSTVFATMHIGIKGEFHLLELRY